MFTLDASSTGSLCFLRFNTIISSHWVSTAIYFLMLFVLSLKKKKILPNYHNDAAYSASDPNKRTWWSLTWRCLRVSWEMLLSLKRWLSERMCWGWGGTSPVSSQLPELWNLNLFNEPLQIFTLKIEAFLISAFNPFNNKINASSSSRITWNWLCVWCSGSVWPKKVSSEQRRPQIIQTYKYRQLFVLLKWTCDVPSYVCQCVSGVYGAFCPDVKLTKRKQPSLFGVCSAWARFFFLYMCWQNCFDALHNSISTACPWAALHQKPGGTKF